MPARTPAVMALPPVRVTSHRVMARPAAVSGPAMATVLIVDDDDGVREVLRLFAEARGLAVVGEARDGRAAVELAARLRPDAVVLDEEMPEVTGLEAIPTLRRHVPGAVIVFYSSGPPAAGRRALALGASAYFQKPASPRTVMAAVAELLDSSRRLAG